MNQRYIDLAIEQVAEGFGDEPSTIRDAYDNPTRGEGSAYQLMAKFAVNKAAALMQVDDVLTTNWITVKDNNYKQALHDLIGFNIQIENDPAVSESAASRKDQLDSLKEENKKLRAALSKLTKEQK